MQDTLQADNDIFDESTLPPARRTSAIGERLRLAREALVVSQAKFALRAGVSPIAYNQYELGKTQPAIDKVIKIRDARCLTENSYHDVRDLAVHWEPAARDDLRWYEWIYWIARVLVDECYQDRRVLFGGVGFGAVALFVYWQPAVSLVVARAGLRFLLLGLAAVLAYACFDAFRSAFWLPDKGACFAARVAAFISGLCSGALAISGAGVGLLVKVG